MAIKSIASVKSHFETGDRPTQAEFGDLIDTLGRVTPIAIASAAEGGKTGIYEILGDGDVTARSTGALGRQLLSVAATASAHNALGISSAASSILASASNDGVAVVTASGASALALTLPTATTTLPGVVRIATSAEASARTSGAVPDASTMGSHPGVAKAWVTFGGSAATSVLSSFNVSTVTRVAQGRFDIEFTTAFANASYAISGMAKRSNNAGVALVVVESTASNPVASRVTINTIATDASLQDIVYAAIVFYGAQ